VHLQDAALKALTPFYVTHQTTQFSQHHGPQHHKINNTQYKPHLTLMQNIKPGTLTCSPGAPKPNLKKKTKTKF
jgi:hypothetical protein